MTREDYDSEEEELRANLKVQQLLMKMYKEQSDDAGKLPTFKTGKTQMTRKSNETRRKQLPQVKSPSDTTLYTPALQKVNEKQQASPVLATGPNQSNVIEQISNFVDHMHIQTARGDQDGDRRKVVPSHDKQTPSTSRGIAGDDEEDQQSEQTVARRKADRMLIQAEQFKATVTPPKGNTVISHDEKYQQLLQLIHDNEDDKFFHLTCHVDQTLRLKIEAGEFIELERLLPKTRYQIMGGSDEQKMQFINKDGMSYWVPADRDNKITNVCKWEQAFRIFAAIYCKAHPHRAPEIWQYIYVINTAASAYVWENVAYYDFTFRQLMSEKSKRSWAKTYNQLWNLAMCETINKQMSSKSNQGSFSNGGSHSGGLGTKGNWRDCCCWRFNRGVTCKKWNCQFDHRCSYCGSWSHNYTQCRKRRDQENDSPRKASEHQGSGRHKHHKKAKN